MSRTARSYGQFCPVAKAAEIFAERWTPLVLRELCCGATRFAELRKGVPLMSKTLLVQRLRELEDAGVVTSAPREGGRGHDYRLTEAGEAFRPVIEAMSSWGQRWMRARIGDADCNPETIVLAIRHHTPVTDLPERRLVARFLFRGIPGARTVASSWWLVFQRPDIEVCYKDPGFEVSVEVSAHLRAFIELWLGYRRLADVVDEGLCALEGAPHDVATLLRTLRLGNHPAPRSLFYTPRDVSRGVVIGAG